MSIRHKKTHTMKYRGTRTCGGGNTKNRRGRGSRMGRTHVKSRGGGQRNKMHVFKYEKERMYRKGFKSIHKKGNSINLSSLHKISPDKEIDVTKFGYDKVLGGGELDSNIKKIIAKQFSAKALEKIKKSGAVAEAIGVNADESKNIRTDN